MMCRRGRFQAVARICSVFVVLLVISEAADRVGIRRLDLPAYDVKHGSGNFTGFNSVDLQKFYIVQKQPAIRSQISPPGGQKPCLGRLPNGDLLATQQLQGAIALRRSADAGRTWTVPRRIDGLGSAQIPGHPLMMPDGRLLIVYGNRQFPFGVQAIASRDGGRTWDTDHPIILAWFSWDHHCGYPRSVLLPDGNIVTAYYARIFTGVPDEIVYTPTNREPGPDVIGHSIRWRPPGNWPTRK